MLWSQFLRRLIVAFVVVAVCSGRESDAASCVWKVIAPSGGTLFLAGSVHALRSSDYPLPASYNRAFEASSRLAFETDPKGIDAASKGLVAAGRYAKGDSLKNHVDPRTYDYVRRFFALRDVPEAKFNTYRPWLINLILESPPAANSQLGLEGYFKGRASKAHKPIEGLETPEEHMNVFVGLNERQSEALLLMFFINLGRANPRDGDAFKSWREGDAALLERRARSAYDDFPAFAERLLAARNRNWIPKIEQFLKSGQTYFVLAGAAHMGGGDGVVALLRARGYEVEQL